MFSRGWPRSPLSPIITVLRNLPAFVLLTSPSIGLASSPSPAVNFRPPVSSLESTIPLLLGKLSSLENRRSHNATVSDNILRVRQLISLARNAVSKVWMGGSRYGDRSAPCCSRAYKQTPFRLPAPGAHPSCKTSEWSGGFFATLTGAQMAPQ